MKIANKQQIHPLYFSLTSSPQLYDYIIYYPKRKHLTNQRKRCKLTTSCIGLGGCSCGWPFCSVSMFGSHAKRNYEPCQVGNEAALSSIPCDVREPGGAVRRVSRRSIYLIRCIFNYIKNQHGIACRFIFRQFLRHIYPSR